MHGIAMVFAMVVMGVIFLVSQVLILREFLLAFQGNEFVVGIVLGSWLSPLPRASSRSQLPSTIPTTNSFP